MILQETTIQEKAFSANWWEETFLKTTDTLTKTSVFKNCISKDETGLMRDEIMSIIRMLCKLRTTQFGFRVFVEGKQLSYKQMNDIYDTPPEEGESVNSWAKRAFGDKKFGIIINRGEKFNNELSTRMAYKISPLLNQVGTPLLGVNFTIFIGNYGWTPLGIHTDAPGESVTHFHLGPGAKTMYTWNNKEYEDLAGDKKFNNKNVEKFLPYANVHPFEEGDLYYMPPNEFHIGRSDELSIGLTLWLNNHQMKDLARKLMTVILDQYLEESEDTMAPDKNPLEDLSAAKEALALIKLPEDIKDLSFNEVMEQVFKDYRYSLYSNSGYWTRPFPKEDETKYTLEDSFVLEKPFVMKYVESLDHKNIYIYVRGTKVVLNNHACIKTLIETINKGEVMTIKEAFNILDSEWDDAIGFYIINLLDTHNGIRKLS